MPTDIRVFNVDLELLARQARVLARLLDDPERRVARGHLEEEEIETLEGIRNMITQGVLDQFADLLVSEKEALILQVVRDVVLANNGKPQSCDEVISQASDSGLLAYELTPALLVTLPNRGLVNSFIRGKEIVYQVSEKGHEVLRRYEEKPSNGGW